MMLALTYQQDPKKQNSTKRLKRISQRFSPGFKHIRLLKEDYLGRFTSKLPYKKNVQLIKRPISFRVPYIKPYKKWKSLLPRSTKKMFFTPGGSFSSNWDNMKQNFIASQQQIGLGDATSLSYNSNFILRDSRQFPIMKEAFNIKHHRLFTACFQQFHLPYDFVRLKLVHVLMGRRAAYIHEMRQKENSFRNRLARITWELNKIKKTLYGLSRNKNANVSKIRLRCFKDIKTRKYELAKTKSDLSFFFRKTRYKNNKDLFATQIPYFDFGSFQHASYPNRFSRFPQTHTVVHEKGWGSILRATPENIRKFAKRRVAKLPAPSSLPRYLRVRNLQQHMSALYKRRQMKGYKTKVLFNKFLQNGSVFSKPNSLLESGFFSGFRKRVFTKVVAFNMFNFNIRSNQVLYRFMENLKHKFGLYSYDIPFRIDVYRKAYQKVKRASKYKQMCIARNKIRLFYGQLSVTKMGRVLRKAPSSFPFMFGLMERRLDVLLVRSNFCKNIFTAQHIVRSGQILVNNKVSRNCFYAVKCYDFVTFKSKQFEMFCKFIVLTKLRLNKFKYNFVPYLVVNYKLMYLYVRPIFDARKQVGFTAPMVHSYLSRY